MARPASTQPTEVELQILRILWELGPSSSREIHLRLAEEKDTNYSTTVKMLSVMLEKGLVKRDETVRPQIYRPAMSQEKAQQRMLNDLIRKVYEGSAKSLVMQALSSSRASQEDLDEIRRLIDELKQQGG
jgi:predicted transcriptional regulator